MLIEVEEGRSDQKVIKQMEYSLAQVTVHGSSVQTIVNVSFVEFDMIKPLQQSFRQFSVRRPFQAVHPRVTAAATVDVLLIELGNTE